MSVRRKKFEYLFADIESNEVQVRFRELGNDGWEYCGHDWGMQIFKREIEQQLEDDS